MGTRDRGEPGRAALLQRERDRRHPTATPNIRRAPTARASRSCRSIGATPAPRRSRRNTRGRRRSDAALAMNEGSRAPDYASGPVWAIFDAAAVQRGRLADPLSLHRRSARRLLPQGRHAGRARQEGHGASASEDAAEISRGDGARGTTRSRTRARTRTSRSRSCTGSTRRRSMRRPRASACSIPTAACGSTGRRRSWTRNGQVIPGLYAGGEASGGGSQHGIGRASVHGYIAGTNAVEEPTV